MKKIIFFLLLLVSAQAGCTLTDPEVMELLQALKVQNDKLLQEVTQMKEQLSGLDGKYQVIQAGLVDNKKELEALKSQMDGLKTQIASQLVKLNQLTVQLEVQGADLEKLSAEILKVKASIEELKALMEELLAGKSPIPTNGLVAWYPFNGNANDESGNRYNGISINLTNAEGRSGIKETGYYFNGNSRINVKSSENDDLDLTSDFSLFSRFKPMDYENRPSVKLILTKHLAGNSQDGGFIFGVWTNNSILPISGIVGFQASPYYNTDTYPDSKGMIQVDKWYDYIVTYKKTTGELCYYLNGELVFKKNLLFAIFKNNMDLIIGAELLNSGFSQQFIGVIDDIGIWKRAMSADEISKIYKGEKF